MPRSCATTVSQPWWQPASPPERGVPRGHEAPGCKKDLTALTARPLGGALEGVVPVPTARLQSAASNPHQPTAPGGETAGRGLIKQEACPKPGLGPMNDDAATPVTVTCYRVRLKCCLVATLSREAKSSPPCYRFSSRLCNESPTSICSPNANRTRKSSRRDGQGTAELHL